MNSELMAKIEQMMQLGQEIKDMAAAEGGADPAAQPAEGAPGEEGAETPAVAAAEPDAEAVTPAPAKDNGNPLADYMKGKAMKKRMM